MIGQKGIPAQSGGVENHVEQLSKHLADKGHEITVYSRDWYCGDKANDTEGIRRVFTPTIATKHLDAITHTLSSSLHALTQDYDVIHFHSVGPALFSWVAVLFSSARVISTFHCIDRKHGKWGRFAQFALYLGEWASCTFPDETIAVSKQIQQYCKEKHNSELHYIPNGVELFERTNKTDKLDQWGLEENNYLLIVSRLISHKGIHYAIKAWKKIKEIDYKLVIVGEGFHSDEYTKRIKQMSKTEDNIVLTGLQTEETLKQLFSHAKLMLSPSDHEGLPIAMLEGMSYQLPIIASNISEHKELIDSQKYLFQQGNYSDLADKITKVLNLPEEKLAKQAEENRQKIKDNFTWDQISKQIEQVYQG